MVDANGRDSRRLFIGGDFINLRQHRSNRHGELAPLSAPFISTVEAQVVLIVTVVAVVLYSLAYQRIGFTRVLGITHYGVKVDDMKCRLCEPISVTNRTGLRHAETEIGNWRAETSARNPPVQDRNSGNCLPETRPHQAKPQSRGVSGNPSPRIGKPNFRMPETKGPKPPPGGLPSSQRP